MNGAPGTIDGVLADLDEIVAWSEAQASRAGYFAALYRRVTATVKDRLGTGYFADDERMELLDVDFAGRYLAAFHGWRTSAPGVSLAWQTAFAEIGDAEPIVLQHLLGGMNAHIDYDLGQAAAAIAPTLAELEELHGDFDKINDLLASLVPTVFVELGEISPLLHLLERVDLPGEDRLVGDALDGARDVAWLLAHELVALSALPAARTALVALKDREVARLGRWIYRPGRSLEAVVKVVAAAESRDVRANLAVLTAQRVLPLAPG